MTHTVLNNVICIVSSTLGIEDRAMRFDSETRLLDSLPELDSMAIVELIVALEDHFDIEFDESEVTAEVFTSIGSLSQFIECKYL
ncbi:MAG: acyl carrier protein [Acidimicrobiales bacterium]